jgi:prepilin-type processing-associated H-X9-DG protein
VHSWKSLNVGETIVEQQNKMRGIDWAAILGCVVLVLMTLGAVGETGRRRAKEAVCQANLRQWHGIFRDYIEDNEGRFLTGVSANGYWWPIQLPHEHQDWKRNRAWLCPMAPTPFMDENGVLMPASNVFRAWGIFSSPTSMSYGGRIYVMNRNGLAGSYGLNGYTLNVLGAYEGGVSPSQGWRDLKDVPQPDRVPLFIDALRFDLWPKVTEGPAPIEDAAWSSNNMGRVCINRHDGAVNCLFVDGSVRKVGLKELWTLKWHRSFDTAGPWTKAGGVSPEDWPAWMRPFKEY